MASEPPSFSNLPARTLARGREQAEAARILGAFQKHKNNRLRAAAELGISRMTLYNKLHRYGLNTRKASASGSTGD